MADFPIEDGAQYELEGKVNTGTTGTTITASASANTKGAFSQLVASTGFNATGIFMSWFMPSAATRFLIDIAVGAAGSEVVVVPNLLFVLLNATASALSFGSVFVPVCIPSGSRVSARCQSSTASATLPLLVHVIGRGLMPASYMGRVTDYGTDTVNTRGAKLDAGGTADTKGAWVQLIASTTNPIRALIPIGINNTSPSAQTRFMVDIGVGAAGSEVVAMPDVPFIAINRGMGVGYQLMPLDVPAGTRLSARAQSSSIVAGDRVIDFTVLGCD